MKKIVCSTNIDAYKTNCFPELSFVPRIGECVNVIRAFESYFIDKRMPCRLEVVNVTYLEGGVLVELHYKEVDFKMMKINGINPY